jgi:hypothetical protein
LLLASHFYSISETQQKGHSRRAILPKRQCHGLGDPIDVQDVPLGLHTDCVSYNINEKLDLSGTFAICREHNC